ncbi:MAG: hypothetical protein M3R65_00385 [Gemmatimonadota bacterium]|nr:hypothetical protein [Gemmatimonadota bacterium]
MPLWQSMYDGDVMKLRTTRVFAAAMLVMCVACGSDSGTGPRNPTVSAQDALRSLASGLASSTGSPSSAILSGSTVAGLSPDVVVQVTVTFDGVPTGMFAVALQTTYPTATCFEQLFPAMSNSMSPAICTPAPQGMAVVLWQTSSATAAPDRLVILYANLGSASFSNLDTFDSGTSALPSFALYLDKSGALSVSSAGTLTSSVRSANQSCSLPLPPFASSATCARVVFTAAGHIAFAADALLGTSGGNHTLDMSATDIGGIVESITGLKTP